MLATVGVIVSYFHRTASQACQGHTSDELSDDVMIPARDCCSLVGTTAVLRGAETCTYIQYIRRLIG